VLGSVGADWLLLREGGGAELLVSRHAVLGVTGVADTADTGGGRGVESRLTLTFALRAIARDRSPVTLTYVDGSTTTGTLDRVGKDFVEVAEHPLGEPRRRGVVRSVRIVPLTALAMLRRVG
jgi:hypothetical protein